MMNLAQFLRTIKMKHLNIGLGVGLILALMFTIFQSPANPTHAASLPQSTPQPAQPLRDAALRQAFSTAIQGRTEVLAFIIHQVEVERLQYSEDGSVALLFLQMRDRTSGEVIATEPGLAIARLNPAASGSEAQDWKISLQADADWVEQLTHLPVGMLTEEGRFMYLPSADLDGAVTLNEPIRGYKLPWAAGLTKNLSGSIGHFLIYNSCSETSCRYAYDFADGTMFPLLAARGGIVHLFYDECANGSESCSNYIVLQDRSTSPWTYQLYLHIAYHSIPAGLRTVGASVLQGQYIANVDDTGYSTGHHLHFHVHTYASSYWGNSVDIAFNEVPFNDGEPRTCYERDNWPAYGSGCANSYTSQNLGANPPTGSLSLPYHGGVFTSSLVSISGTAADDISVTKVQPVVNFGSGWVEIGQPFSITPGKNVTFSGEADLCAANAPDGPLQIGVFAYDYEGNRSVTALGERQIFKSATCTTPAPPACVPGSNQVSLFTEVDYKGDCRTFSIGNYTEWNGTLPSLLANKIDSILVGSNVTVTGYDGDYDPTYIKFAGRGETYYTSDPNLADNKFTSNQITAIRVMAKSSLLTPVVDPIGPVIGRSPTSVESLILSAMSGNEYENADGVNTFTASLSGPAGSVELPEQKYPAWSVGNLAAGSYTFTVHAKSGTLIQHDAESFTVTSASLPAAANRSLPFLDSMEGGTNDWAASGLWSQFSTEREGSNTTVWGYSTGSGYASSTIRGGDLTSPPITLPANGAYLRFDYLYQTENRNPFWDQRRVQISVDGGAFTDILQLSDDPMNYWLHSPVIPLTGSTYSGKTIRIRFHFNTIDGIANANFVGWLVDNVSLNTTAPDLSCAEATRNDTPASASAISIGGSKNGVICSGGDLDFYAFTATAGQRLIVEVEAAVNGSALDSVLRLVDSDQKSVLVENDDASPATTDSHLTYTVQRNGTYYLRVSAWDHPSAGSPQHTYTLRLTQDVDQPSIGLVFPNSQYIPGPVFPLVANLIDPSGSGAARVDVYYHSTDWLNSPWELVGSDDTPQDGFLIPLDLSSKGPAGGSLLAQGFDVSGRSAVALVSGLTYDTTLPSASFTPLPVSGSTRFPVQWSVSDTLSGLASFSIQVQVDGGAWANWLSAPPLDLRQEWFSGQLGHTYGFRLQALDVAGNLRAYPGGAEIVTSVANCSADAFEDGDDLTATAPTLELDVLQAHNFCQAADVDWMKIGVLDDHPLVLAAESGTGMGDYQLSLFAADGQTPLLEVNSAGGGSWIILPFTPPGTGGNFFIRVRPLVADLAGDANAYNIKVFKAYYTYLPAIAR